VVQINQLINECHLQNKPVLHQLKRKIFSELALIMGPDIKLNESQLGEPKNKEIVSIDLTNELLNSTTNSEDDDLLLSQVNLNTPIIVKSEETALPLDDLSTQAPKRKREDGE
jgi:hypothetical protein